jgi:hypothetical protein
MKLVPMKRTSAEKKAQENRYKTIGPSSGEDYGYGLCITLDKSALEKLGMKPSSFDVGDTVSFEGVGIIKSLRQDKSSSYDSSSVEIQITKFGVEDGGPVGAVDSALADLDEDDE